MNRIRTITEFLESTGVRLTIYDIGRRIIEISREDFLQFEKTERAYPYPLQRQAWFALLYDNAQSGTEPFIWFLRFPLDEQGKLIQAARDDFMHRMMERLEEKLAAETEQQIASALEDNPYTFKPRDDRMAVFHAKTALRMGQPPSEFYPHAREYFRGDLGWDQWAFLGYQGIAEVAARFSEENQQDLVQAIARMPIRPLEALCHCLENEAISTTLTQALLDRTLKELDLASPDSALLQATIRGASLSADQELKLQLVLSILNHPCSADSNILTAVSSRCWELLKRDITAAEYLERLANGDSGQEGFNQCLIDLLFLPSMREPLLQAMRNPHRSEQLALAMGTFLQSVGG